ncbi:universal stress protein [Alkaliphilus serpentinus]|nr:universal stress protein [Alkaliphilus serpentinus]
MKKVLIATDFSPAAEALLNCIDEFKRMGLEEAILVHVIDIRFGEETIIDLQLEAIKKLESIGKKLEAYGIKTKKYTPVGFAATEIVQIARTEEASLILIGSKGKSVLKEVFLGSTTFDVIRLADVPVLVEKYNKHQGHVKNVCINKFQKILIPMDFSDYSTAIIEKVMTISPNIIEEIILLSVVEQGETLEEIEDAKKQYRELLEEIAGEFRDFGIRVKVEAREGIPSVAITELANEEEVTSIVMGTRGRGLIKALLLGSTSDAVARISKRPVILIPVNATK